MRKALTNHIMMVRPAAFGYNSQTAGTNAFQSEPEQDQAETHRLALQEFDNAVNLLRGRGVKVTVIDDTQEAVKPDAIFPNNWVSFHEGGVVITYPMFAENRRIERREEILEAIAQERPEGRRYAFEYYEEDGLMLEGTGSLVLDRVNKVAYASLSSRTDIRLLDKWCVLMKYKAMPFNATDAGRQPIYHTNVIMALGQDFAVICLDSVSKEEEKDALVAQLESADKKVIPITRKQVDAYAGNMMQVLDGDGKPLLIMSEAAYESLDQEQLNVLKERTGILPISIPVIELVGGGSIRCMMAELF